jgi:hypothetical protein
MVQMPQNCHGILYLPSVGLKLEDLPIHGIQESRPPIPRDWHDSLCSRPETLHHFTL